MRSMQKFVKSDPWLLLGNLLNNDCNEVSEWKLLKLVTLTREMKIGPCEQVMGELANRRRRMWRSPRTAPQLLASMRNARTMAD